ATDSPEEVRAWFNARVGKTQRLSGLRFTGELPRSEIGKVLKRQLRQAWAEAAVDPSAAHESSRPQ
ncbi:MAG: hypothetical protein LH617_10855, partial [Ramlibacter sp.]|nr:hypothetical protein [Ramlibacter sp.]